MISITQEMNGLTHEEGEETLRCECNTLDCCRCRIVYTDYEALECYVALASPMVKHRQADRIIERSWIPKISSSRGKEDIMGIS